MVRVIIGRIITLANRVNDKAVAGALATLVVALVVAGGWYMRTVAIPILQPRGTVAKQELDLMFIALILSAIVVIPVFILLGIIAWKYRAGNKKAMYTPDVDGNRTLETIWWLIPSFIILILAVITWQSSHKLDPYRELNSSKPPVQVQVVALDWKWLFIYPQQHIASVNFLQIPLNTPVDFDITADAPMNSFWIPQLGGQIYAMPGMLTQLHLMASKPGDYQGSSANISGKGFASMRFTTRASSDSEFASWVQSVRQSPLKLTQDVYSRLSKPSTANPVVAYSATDSKLYGTILDKYMKSGLVGVAQ